MRILTISIAWITSRSSGCHCLKGGDGWEPREVWETSKNRSSICCFIPKGHGKNTIWYVNKWFLFLKESSKIWKELIMHVTDPIDATSQGSKKKAEARFSFFVVLKKHCWWIDVYGNMRAARPHWDDIFTMLHCCIHLCHPCQANRDSSKGKSVEIFNPIVLIVWSNRLKSINQMSQIKFQVIENKSISNFQRIKQKKGSCFQVSKHQFSELVNVNHTLPTQRAGDFQSLWLPHVNGLPMFYSELQDFSIF